MKDQTSDDELQAIRDSVEKLCADFPGEYWRELDRERAYPTAFVKALTDAGYLGCLIPEEYGGSGLGIREAAAIALSRQRPERPPGQKKISGTSAEVTWLSA